MSEHIVFEEIIRSRPRRRASHSIAGGFSPTASAVERNKCSISMSPTARGACRIIAVLRYVDPCPGLPHCAQRPLAATGAAPSKRPCERCAPPLHALGVSAVYVLFTAETRSTRRGWRTRRLLSMVCSNPPNRTDLCENCYTFSISISPTARDAYGGRSAPDWSLRNNPLQPAQAGFAVHSRGLQPHGTRRIRGRSAPDGL